MPDATDDDITALRRQGDLGRYLRGLIRPTRPAAPSTPAATAHGPHHRTGAWPHGTHPTTSLICHPACGCALHPPARTDPR